ncbi:MAG: helicase-related protein [bacterium]
MPQIFDNIHARLNDALSTTLAVSHRADFCVGYFNLRGWKLLHKYFEQWSGQEENRCRLLVGMHKLPHDQLREALSPLDNRNQIDNQTALELKKRVAREFHQQLVMGTPTNEDEDGLRRLAAQIRAKKIIVKLFLRHPLHAKLYLLFRSDPINPVVGYLGSSNLTFSGLAGQGELNIDVLDGDACQKLAAWFDDRWQDRFCVDISEDLVKLIEESWAREDLVPPYHIYLKMAYHLAEEAREGLHEFRIPADFGKKLFEYQTAAVKIAAHHLNKRDGVLIGDVVGLGKTLMATALARIFEDDLGLETLILCPKNLVGMWKDHREQYRLRGKVLSISRVIGELPHLPRYRLVLIDESQNLRNREGKCYKAIQEYIQRNDSKCILLSATPYNKTYIDLSNQLRLFVPEDINIGIRPELLLREIGETEFIRRHQCPVRSLAAFEKSVYADDWRELMRLYLVRRTRSFIQDNYAETDPETGRKFLTFEDGEKSFFPTRVPKTAKFKIDEKDPNDQYARLYDAPVVDSINSLTLPRYGLGNYITTTPDTPLTASEQRQLQDLSRAGIRLMGFCRTNLFKRLESGGAAFLLSIERHILRNYVFLHAIQEGAPLPVGSQGAELLDSRFTDADAEGYTGDLFENDENGGEDTPSSNASLRTKEDFVLRAAYLYAEYSGPYRKRFNWLRPDLFVETLAENLQKDSDVLLKILQKSGDWDPARDAKLEALLTLLTQKHPGEKILVFSQFADTVRYLESELVGLGVQKLAGVTGDSSDPTTLAYRFSPESNNRRDRIAPDNELRVLVATDILSEGQNLQDCAIVINYDLPWAIIRLVQRAGRVDRIGQKSEQILCYSFLPAEGVDRIIRLRGRVRQRLRENAEVVGTDEAFFEDDRDDQTVLDLYNENAGILEGDPDGEVDLASYAYQIWKNAIDEDRKLEKVIPALPGVVYSSRSHQPTQNEPEGVLVYLRTGEGNDALAYIGEDGKSVTESQFEILKLAECAPDTPAQPRHTDHHSLVQKGVRHIVQEEKRVGGQLGRPSGARFRTYERLKSYTDAVKDTLMDIPELQRAIDDIYRYPLRPTARDILNRQLRGGIEDPKLAELVMALRDEDRLCIVDPDIQTQDPQIICSMGLFEK